MPRARSRRRPRCAPRTTTRHHHDPDRNVRRHDPAERQALAALRDGSVPDAVAWYATHDRIRTQPTRLDTLTALADGWAADVAVGHRTALLAWRRADVADLNRLARQHHDDAGLLSGPDVEMPGGRRYAVGDRIVALAPNPTAGVVTSEQLTIAHIDPDRITVRADDGRRVRLTGAARDAEHLDHAYALTMTSAPQSSFLTCWSVGTRSVTTCTRVGRQAGR